MGEGPMPGSQPMLKNLAPRYYAEAGIYRDERQAIFRRHWHMLGPVTQVGEPGQYLALELANWKLFILHGNDGTLRAFHNVCRHRGARLLEEGNGRCEMLRCPYHLWVYGHDGQLRNAPWFGEDAGFRLADWPLEPIALDTSRAPLFAATAPDTTPTAQPRSLPGGGAEYTIASSPSVAAPPSSS